MVPNPFVFAFCFVLFLFGNCEGGGGGDGGGGGGGGKNTLLISSKSKLIVFAFCDLQCVRQLMTRPASFRSPMRA